MDAPHGSVRTAPNGRFVPTRARNDRPPRDDGHIAPSLAVDDDATGTDWRAIATFGTGLAIGALLGAGAALLLAPASGFETRMRLVHGARRAGSKAADQWEAVGERVRDSARRGRRSLRRKMTVGRWRAEDAWERRRRPETDD